MPQFSTTEINYKYVILLNEICLARLLLQHSWLHVEESELNESVEMNL